MSIEKEINLASIVEVMWNRAKGIIIFTFATMILAMIATMTMQNRYTATSKLIMNKSKLGTHTMQNPAIPMNTYLDMALDDALLKNLLETYKLTEPPFNFRYRADLLDRIEVDSEEETSLIEIVVQLEDPEIAAEVANAVAQDLTDKSISVMQMESSFSSTHIAEEVERVSEVVEINRKKYEDVMVSNLLEQVVNKLNTTNSILALAISEKANLESQIIQYRTKSEHLGKSLESPDFNEVVKTRNNVLFDPVAENTLRSQVGDLSIQELSQIEFMNETVNVQYLEMKREYETLLADLAAAEAALADKIIKIASLEQETAVLQAKVNRMNIEESYSKMNFDRSLEILGGIDKQEGWAGTSVVTERQDLFRVIDAIPPDRKSYPQRSLMVGIVGSIAFLLSFMYYLLRDLYGLVKEEKLKKRDPEILS